MKKSNSSLFKSSDPTKCNKAMGVTSLKSSIKKLRYCNRPADTCQYHSKK